MIRCLLTKYFIFLLTLIFATSCSEMKSIMPTAIDFSEISSVQGSGVDIGVKLRFDKEVKLKLKLKDVEITLFDDKEMRICSFYSKKTIPLNAKKGEEVIIPLEVTFPGGVASSQRAIDLLENQKEDIYASGRVEIKKCFFKKEFVFEREPVLALIKKLQNQF